MEESGGPADPHQQHWTDASPGARAAWLSAFKPAVQQEIAELLQLIRVNHVDDAEWTLNTLQSVNLHRCRWLRELDAGPD